MSRATHSAESFPQTDFPKPDSPKPHKAMTTSPLHRRKLKTWGCQHLAQAHTDRDREVRILAVILIKPVHLFLLLLLVFLVEHPRSTVKPKVTRTMGFSLGIA